METTGTTEEDAAERAVQFTISLMREFIAQGEEYNARHSETGAAVATLQMARGLVAALEALSPRIIARFDNIAFMMAVLIDLCATLWSGGRHSDVTLDGVSMVKVDREVHYEHLN